ncbi:unnamed protein product, partial [Staurois parvus]
SGLGSEWGKCGCCRICGLPIGICKHIRKDTRGVEPVCELLVVAGQYSPLHQLVLHLWDSPRHQVILQC